MESRTIIFDMRRTPPRGESTTRYLGISSVAGLVSGSHARQTDRSFSIRDQSQKLFTPEGEVLIRKQCKCGNEFVGTAAQTRCEKCLEKKAKRK